LIETYKQPRSAGKLAEICEVSEPTIYRRVEKLREHELVDGVQKLDPQGHHYEEFVARLDQITIELTEGGFVVRVNRTEKGAADRFTELYEELSG
jgi:DNA-binding transcriptional ArsR family regulator